MTLTGFHALSTRAARDAVRSCADVPRWARAVAAGRPYDDVDDLVDHADEVARSWTGGEVERALADHPRIGERATGGGASAAMSTREQSGVDRTDPDVVDRLAAGNAAYEQRFGRVFLVRAAGRDAASILALLEQRLQHDDATELRVTAQQLREIALLRLRALVQGDRVVP